MKKKLTTVFFTIYILLGVLGFLLVTYVGSHLLENRLEKIHKCRYVPDSSLHCRK